MMYFFSSQSEHSGIIRQGKMMPLAYGTMF
jgi:hypothetical protein